MNTLSLVHWLLIGNMVMLSGVALFVFALRRQQAADAERLAARIDAMEQGYGAMSKSTIGLGRRIKQVEARAAQTERQVGRTAPDDARYEQASRLVGMGASASDLIDSLGVARAEAELFVSMKRSANA
jgi:hypothetical protein